MFIFWKRSGFRCFFFFGGGCLCSGNIMLVFSGFCCVFLGGESGFGLLGQVGLFWVDFVRVSLLWIRDGLGW